MNLSNLIWEVLWDWEEGQFVATSRRGLRFPLPGFDPRSHDLGATLMKLYPNDMGVFEKEYKAFYQKWRRAVRGLLKDLDPSSGGSFGIGPKTDPLDLKVKRVSNAYKVIFNGREVGGFPSLPELYEWLNSDQDEAIARKIENSFDDGFSYTLTEIAQKVGKSESAIAERLQVRWAAPIITNGLVEYDYEGVKTLGMRPMIKLPFGQVMEIGGEKVRIIDVEHPINRVAVLNDGEWVLCDNHGTSEKLIKDKSLELFQRVEHRNFIAFRGSVKPRPKGEDRVGCLHRAIRERPVLMADLITASMFFQHKVDLLHIPLFGMMHNLPEGAWKIARYIQEGVPELIPRIKHGNSCIEHHTALMEFLKRHPNVMAEIIIQKKKCHSGEAREILEILSSRASPSTQSIQAPVPKRISPTRMRSNFAGQYLSIEGSPAQRVEDKAIPPLWEANGVYYGENPRECQNPFEIDIAHGKDLPGLVKSLKKIMEGASSQAWGAKILPRLGNIVETPFVVGHDKDHVVISGLVTLTTQQWQSRRVDKILSICHSVEKGKAIFKESEIAALLDSGAEFEMTFAAAKGQLVWYDIQTDRWGANRKNNLTQEAIQKLAGGSRKSLADVRSERAQRLLDIGFRVESYDHEAVWCLVERDGPRPSSPHEALERFEPHLGRPDESAIAAIDEFIRRRNQTDQVEFATSDDIIKMVPAGHYMRINGSKVVLREEFSIEDAVLDRPIEELDAEDMDYEMFYWYHGSIWRGNPLKRLAHRLYIAHGANLEDVVEEMEAIKKRITQSRKSRQSFEAMFGWSEWEPDREMFPRMLEHKDDLRVLASDSRQIIYRRSEDEWYRVKERSMLPKKEGESWRACECGKVPVYAPRMQCESCWPTEDEWIREGFTDEDHGFRILKPAEDNPFSSAEELESWKNKYMKPFDHLIEDSSPISRERYVELCQQAGIQPLEDDQIWLTEVYENVPNECHTLSTPHEYLKFALNLRRSRSINYPKGTRWKYRGLHLRMAMVYVHRILERNETAKE